MSECRRTAVGGGNTEDGDDLLVSGKRKPEENIERQLREINTVDASRTGPKRAHTLSTGGERVKGEGFC